MQQSSFKIAKNTNSAPNDARNRNCWQEIREAEMNKNIYGLIVEKLKEAEKHHCC